MVSWADTFADFEVPPNGVPPNAGILQMVVSKIGGGNPQSGGQTKLSKKLFSEWNHLAFQWEVLAVFSGVFQTYLEVLSQFEQTG